MNIELLCTCVGDPGLSFPLVPIRVLKSLQLVPIRVLKSLQLVPIRVLKDDLSMQER